MEVLFASYSDVGGRSVNEDSMLAVRRGERHLFAVADGLGGHGMGDTASRCVCSTALRCFEGLKQCSNQMFADIFGSCQSELLQQQQTLRASGKMRTTLNLLCLTPNMAYWSHIGDSRTYYFQNKQLIGRTFDHSVPQMLAAAGQLKESEIRFHEDRNRLLKVLGVEGQAPAYDCEQPIPLAGDQQFLICSDGFWELISEEQMLLCLEEADEPQLWLDDMLELHSRNCHGTPKDNVTAIAVWIK